MSKIEIGRWSDQLRRMLGQKGISVVSGDLSPEISPTIQLESPGKEWDFLKSVRACSGFLNIAGAAGFRTRFRLRNPQASGVIAIIQGVSMFPTAIADLRIGIAQIFGDYGVGGLPVVEDIRWGGTVLGSTLQLSSDVTSALLIPGNIIAGARPVANTEWLYPNPIPLPPGSNLEWGSNGTNITVASSVWWIERAISPLEL